MAWSPLAIAEYTQPLAYLFLSSVILKPIIIIQGMVAVSGQIRSFCDLQEESTWSDVEEEDGMEGMSGSGEGKVEVDSNGEDNREAAGVQKRASAAGTSGSAEGTSGGREGLPRGVGEERAPVDDAYIQASFRPLS